MTYNPNIPNQANLVRTASGDLALMQGNFNDLAPLVSGTVTSGTAPSAAIRGFYFGDTTNRKRYFLQSDGSDLFQVMRNVSGEGSPVWQTVLSFTQVSGEDATFAVKVSGVTPTDAAHLATKNYVDTNPTLSGLADTSISSPSSGQTLEWDGSDWTNVNHAHALNDLTDVSIVSPTSGEALVYNGAQWSADALKLSEHLSDVTVSGATSGQVLTYDGADWTAEDASGGSPSLSGLTDTSISSPASGDLLMWDGSNWVNTDAPSGDRVICVLSGAQTQTIPQSVATTFSGDEVPFNQGGFTVASGSITIPDGITRVDIQGEASWASSAVGTNYEAHLRLNGVCLSGLANYNLAARDRRRKSTTSDICHQNVAAFDVPVTSGDVITMTVFQDGVGAGLNITGGTGLLVREATNGGPGPAGADGADGSTTLSGLTDTAVSGATSGQVLTSDGAGSWTAEDSAGGGGGFVSGIIGRKLSTDHSPVGLWNFEEDLTDDSGNGFDLTVEAGEEAYTTINGLTGLWMAGTDDNFWQSTSGTALAISGDLTIEAIMMSDDYDATRVVVNYITTEGADIEPNNSLYSLRTDITSGQLTYFAETGAGVNIEYTPVSGIRSRLTTLNHVVMVRDSDDVTFYLNGAQVGAASTGLSGVTGGVNSKLQVGFSQFNGVLCSLKIIDSALTSGQVWAEYERTWAQAVSI